MKRNYSDDLANGTMNEDDVVESSEIYGGMISRIYDADERNEMLLSEAYADNDCEELNFDRE